MAEAQGAAGSLTENDSHPRNSQPLVSVIIPVYNAEKYVEQAVRSILNQTYQNLEILITDDCSADGSFAILQKLAEEDARIKLFRNEHNQKIVCTLNALVERATGKYIARMDADDISLAKRIEKQVAFLEANPCIAICGTNAWHIDEEGKIIGCSFLATSHERIQVFKLCANPFYHPSVIVRKEILSQFNYDEKFLHAEDYALWLNILESNKGHNTKERLICYRIPKKSDSQKCMAQSDLLKTLAPRRNDLKVISKIRPLSARGNIICSLILSHNIRIHNILRIKFFLPLIFYLLKNFFATL